MLRHCPGKRFSAICAMVLVIILYQGASVAATQLNPPASAGLRFGLMCGVLALLAATIFLIPLGSGMYSTALSARRDSRPGWASPASVWLPIGFMCGVLALLAATIFLIPLGSGAHQVDRA